jgi:O-antigen ligase
MRDEALRPVPSVPPAGWWLVGLASVAASLLVHPLAGLAVLALVIIQRARPFDFLTSYLVVTVMGSFVVYTNNTLTAQLTVLTGYIVFMLYCYVLERRWDSLVLPRTPATKPLLVYLGLTVANFVRGMAMGNPWRYAGLELFIVLVMASSLLVASRRWTKTERRYALAVMWIMGFCHFLLGTSIWLQVHQRTLGVYFTGVSSVVAMLIINYALRAKTRYAMLMWVLASAPLFAHEFLSFTRGYWLATFGATAFSIAVYVGRREGAKQRAANSAFVLVLLAGVALAGAALLASVVGMGHALEQFSDRLASSAGTKYTRETASNFIRLLESVKVLELIRQSPLFGHGLGYCFVFRDPFNGTINGEQYFVHQNYLWVWLKQGIIGLALFIWMIIGFLRTGIAGRSLPDLEEQAWCMGSASMVVWVMIYMFMHFPLAESNTAMPFTLAMGATMGYAAKGTIALRWKNRGTAPRE